MAGYSGNNKWVVTLAADAAVDVMSSVSNGIGGVFTYAYKPSSNYQFQNTLLPFVVQTVASLSVNDGNGNSATTQYEYRYWYCELPKREFRGFGYARQMNADGTTLESWYHQRNIQDPYMPQFYYDDEDFKGKPYRIEFRAPWPYFHIPGALLSTTELTWQRSLPWQHGIYPIFVKLGRKKITSTVGGTSVMEDTTYTYDDTNGNILTVTTSGTDAETITTTNTFQNFSNWLWRNTKTTVTGSVSAKVRETTHGYETTTGNMLWKEYWLNGGTNPRIRMEYTPEGNIFREYDAKNKLVKTIAYDATKTFATQTANALGHQARATYDYRFGAPACTWDANNNKTCNTYDAYGRVIETVAYEGEGPVKAAKTKIEYDDVSFPNRKRTRVLETEIGGVETYIDKYEYFDGLGRAIQTATLGENSQPVVSRMHYDTMGRAALAEGPYYAGGTTYPQQPPAAYPWALTTYDYFGKPVRAERPDQEHGTVTSTVAYAGLTTTFTDADGRRKSEKKDYLGRLIEVKEYADAGAVYTTRYTYNAAGDLLNVKDHYNTTTTMTYDTLGRKRTMIDPDMGSWIYEYDANGNLSKQTDAKNQVITFTYDDLNRVLAKTYSSGEPTVVYTYDSLTIPNGIGKPASVNNGNGIRRVDDYDALGRPTSVTRTISGDSAEYTTMTEFDLSGKQTRLVYPDGTWVRNSYFPGTSLLSQVTGSDGTVYADLTLYEPSGKMGELHMGNGTATRFSYDPWSTKMQGIVTALPTSNGDPKNDIFNRAYSYTPAGDIAAIIDFRKGAELGLPGNIFQYTYQYDSLHRLTGEMTGESVTTVTPPSCPDGGTYSAANDRCESPVITNYQCPVNGTIFSNQTTCTTSCNQTASCIYTPPAALSGAVTTAGNYIQVTASGNAITIASYQYTDKPYSLTLVRSGTITLSGATASGSFVLSAGDLDVNPYSVVTAGNQITFKRGLSDPQGVITISGATASGAASFKSGATITGSGNKLLFSTSGSITVTNTTPAYTCPLGSYACGGTPASCSKPMSCNAVSGCQSGYTMNGSLCTAAGICPSGGTLNPVTDQCENYPIPPPPGGFTPLAFAYDAVGNITSKTAGSTNFVYSYDPLHKHAVSSITVNGTSYAFTYDLNGNMKTGYDLTDPANVGYRQFTYNADNMPIRIVYTKGGVTKTTNFLYDDTGQRIKKYSASGTAYYIGDHYEVINGAVVKYVFAGNLRIAKVTATGTHYFHKDHLGSSTVMTDAAGNIVESTDYLPFGGQRLHTGTVVSNYKFTDQEFDPETGLYYYGARYYDPTLGRFISADTVVQDFSDPQMLNRYSYARNNPLLYADPSGHFIQIVIGAIIGAVIGGVVSALTGGNVGMGILTGAIGGAFFGAASVVVGTVGATFAEVVRAAAIYAVAGAAAGAVNSAIYGGNIGQGALYGAIGGAIGGAAGVAAAGVGEEIYRITLTLATAGVTGGIMAELSGAKFSEGMLTAMLAAGMSYGMGKLAMEIEKANAQKGVAAEVNAEHSSRYHLDVDLELRVYDPARDMTTLANQVAGPGAGNVNGVLACVGRCITTYDPLSLDGKISLSALGGTLPKRWVGMAVSGKPYTTILSRLSLGHGTAAAGTNLARIVGRIFSPVWIGYGLIMAGVEAHCIGACLADARAY